MSFRGNAREKRAVALALLLALMAIIVLRCHRGGTITEGESGRPIAGAVVNVSWGRYPLLPSPHGSPPFGCMGNTTATTDAAGNYQVSIPLSTALNPMTIYRVRAIAPRYYDDVWRQGLAEPYESIARELPWQASTGDVEWSRSLRSFGPAGMDAKLLAQYANAVTDSCGHDRAFEAQRWRVLGQTLCEHEGRPSPSVRRDVFGFLLATPRPDLPADAQQRFARLSQELVGASSSDRTAGVLQSPAIENACTLIRAQLAFPSFMTPATMNLRVRLDASEDAARVAGLPVRMLWGSRYVDHPGAGGGYTREWSVRRGLLARSDGDGTVTFAVTPEMLAEQGEPFRYEVIPIDDEVVTFGDSLPGIVLELDGDRLHASFKARSSELRPPGERAGVISIDEVERLAANPGQDAEMLDGGRLWRYPPSVAGLTALRDRAAEPRPDTADDPALRRIRVFPWHWPAVAALWRAHALIAMEPDVESDPAALTALQYAEGALTFDRMCAEPDQRLTKRETLQALQVLWWMEAQASGREAADERARRRATSWDRGVTCTFDRGQVHTDGAGTPIRSSEVCRAWRSMPQPSLPQLRSYHFRDLALDFSNRPGACPRLPNNGAFQ